MFRERCYGRGFDSRRLHSSAFKKALVWGRPGFDMADEYRDGESAKLKP